VSAQQGTKVGYSTQYIYLVHLHRFFLYSIHVGGELKINLFLDVGPFSVFVKFHVSCSAFP